MIGHLLLMIGLFGAADDAKAALDKWQGTWTAVSLENEGKKAEDVKDHTLTVKDDSYTMKTPDNTTRGKLTLDPSKTPATMEATFVDEDDKEAGKVLGIYKFEGGRLIVCWADEGNDRPTDFTTGAGSGRRMIVLKRE